MAIRKTFFMTLLGLCLLPAGLGWAADSASQDLKDDADTNFQYQTVTTKEGLHFRVPEDMPIQKKDGIVAPVSFDEYMYGKFKKMDVRMDRMESKLDKIEKLLEEIKQSQPKVLKASGTNP